LPGAASTVTSFSRVIEGRLYDCCAGDSTIKSSHEEANYFLKF
jgi:hypothetical protein